jgi:hypothetical protein
MTVVDWVGLDGGTYGLSVNADRGNVVDDDAAYLELVVGVPGLFPLVGEHACPL